MPIYKYCGILKNGKKKSGIITAEKKCNVISKLSKSGINVISVSRVIFLFNFSTGQELIQFFTYMLFQIKCCVPILTAISSYTEISKNIAVKAVFEQLYQTISSGTSLYDAFSSEKKLFGDIIPSLLQSAEISGMLEESINSILIYLKFRENIKQKIKRAAMYPTFVLIMAILALGFCVSCIGPQVQDLVNTADIHYIMTDFCLAVIPEEECFAYFIAFIIILLGMFLLLPKWLLIRICFFLPVIRPFLQKIYEWNCCVTLYISLKSNIDLVKAMNLMISVIKNTHFEQEFKKIIDHVANGIKLSDAMSESTIMSNETIQALKIGEENNQLVSTLHNIIRLQSNNIDFSIKNMGNTVGISITLITGVLLIIILLGLFYPLYSNIDMVRQ